jgi:hypothetical protein
MAGHCSKPATARNSELLPLPEGPTKATNSPGAQSKLASNAMPLVF